MHLILFQIFGICIMQTQTIDVLKFVQCGRQSMLEIVDLHVPGNYNLC